MAIDNINIDCTAAYMKTYWELLILTAWVDNLRHAVAKLLYSTKLPLNELICFLQIESLNDDRLSIVCGSGQGYLNNDLCRVACTSHCD